MSRLGLNLALFSVLGAAAPPPPTISSVSPATGTLAGGTAVTIAGTGFSGSSVTIGGAAATSVVVVSPTSITCVTPAGVYGARDVVVTNADTQSGTRVGGFTYDAAWTGWWDGDNYNAITGVAAGKAGVGSSAGRDLSEATTKPTKGNLVNGHSGIIFNGSNQKLNGSATIGNLITTAAWTIYAVANVASFGTANNAPGYTMPPVIGDSGSYWAQGALDNNTGGGGNGKICGYSLTTGGEKTVRGPTATGLHLLELIYDGTSESVSIDGATATSIAAAALNTSALAGTIRMGTNWNQGAYFTGTIYEVMTLGATLSSANRAAIRAGLASKYGQSWP